MPMMEMFDRGIQLRMGQAHVKRWIDDILPAGVRRLRGPARRARPHHPPGAAGRGAAHVRGLPEEAGRLHQGRAQAVTPALPARIGGGDHRGLRAASAGRPRTTLAGRGARLVLVARGRARRWRRPQRSAGRPGAEVVTVVADVVEEDDVARVRDAAVRRFGRVDVLGAHRRGGGVRAVRGRPAGDVPTGGGHRAARDGARRTGRLSSSSARRATAPWSSPARCSARSRRRT